MLESKGTLLSELYTWAELFQREGARKTFSRGVSEQRLGLQKMCCKKGRLRVLDAVGMGRRPQNMLMQARLGHFLCITCAAGQAAARMRERCAVQGPGPRLGARAHAQVARLHDRTLAHECSGESQGTLWAEESG